MEVLQRDFHHPYKPYDIQIELMNAIYQCASEAKIGIFESPTGTGKSLSLICSSLKWLRDFQETVFESEGEARSDNDEPAWVREHARQERRRAAVEQRLDIEARLQKIRAKELRQKQRYEKGDPNFKRPKLEKVDRAALMDDDTQFELEEYNSEDEDKPTRRAAQISEPGVSSASLDLMQKLGLTYKPVSNDELAPIDEIKILYCSRTHSQLAQFTQELLRVDLPTPSWATINEHPQRLASNEPMSKDSVPVKHLPLGSRKNLCINPKVSSLMSVTAINELCLELQQPDTAKDHKCAFLPTKDNQTLVNDFRDHTLAAIRDIEDMGDLGKKIGICPYYASRATIKPSEVNPYLLYAVST